MRRLILNVLLAVGLLAAISGPARACIWDREVVTHEEKFKSSYIDQPPPPAGSVGFLVGGIGEQVLALVAAGVGISLLLAAALFIALRRPRLRPLSHVPRNRNEEAP